ncbi:unnamed protein product [Caretta caretta]
MRREEFGGGREEIQPESDASTMLAWWKKRWDIHMLIKFCFANGGRRLSNWLKERVLNHVSHGTNIKLET